MTVIETTELFSAIKEGYFDAALKEITAAVRSREFAVANQITIGDRIKITGTMKPKLFSVRTGEGSGYKWTRTTPILLDASTRIMGRLVYPLTVSLN